AIRALGSGKKVHMLQFIKAMPYGELNILGDLPGFSYELLGRDCFIEKKPDREDSIRAQRGLKKAEECLVAQSYDLLILDEVHIALYYGLIELPKLIAILEKRKNTEVICTGRYAPRQLMEIADLVTEMREIKHYYEKGIYAREGIEF
ncbi:MAG: cob(I)yrinic acid a,c-diamide adenosyltransferase, partial [Tissierellia bacterium]|nr:cob(I)yrinic acid a,c-diamide adenosyltransferase [Tissierellia bacterium]